MDDTGTVYYYDEQTDLRKKFDYIFRVKEDPDTSSFEATPIEDTKQFFYSYYGLLQENNVLKTSLNNVWKIHSYNQEYISYLLGSYTKDEFKKIAEKYAEPIVEDIPGDQLVAASEILCSTLNKRLPIIDLSLLLNVTPSYFDETIKLLDYSLEQCGTE